MDLKHIVTLLFLFGNILVPLPLIAQEDADQPTDDLGNVTDAFQENFFEALKQKGIENHELALEALRKAELSAKDNLESKAVVYFEMGKNLKKLKRYDEAEENFQKVIASQGERLDVMEALYDLYYLQRNYEAAIPLVQKLIPKDEDYKEDLANLYHRTKQYDKSLALLDELDELWGESIYRNALRRQIYKVTGNTSGAIGSLEKKIGDNSKSEQDYLNLIFLYSEQGDTKKAFATAKELLKNQPKSQLAHLALYKFYLEEDNTQEALKSMNIVFKSNAIEKDSKYRVLSDFIGFVSKNPELEVELDKVVALFSEDGNGQVYEQLGNYYLAKNDKGAALRFFEKGVSKDEDNFSLLKNTLLLQIDEGQFDNASSLSSSGLEIFPAQPLLYLINGVAQNGLSNADAAIEIMETGIDYLFDDPKMEKDFYDQLSKAYTLKGDSSKAKEYSVKSAEIKAPN